MKITTPVNLQPPSSTNANKTAPKRSAESAAATFDNEADASGGVQKQDFASVLESVTRAEESRQEESNEETQTQRKFSEHTEAETPARRREERRGDDGSGMGGGGFQQSGVAREEGLSGEPVGARAILHIADLEKLASTVRAQIQTNGQREVTLQLHRSVLEGLRVKLSADATGRITAEFIAASERMRAQLDARSAELADLLRSRGINLAALRTSVASDTDRNASGDDSRSGAQGSFASIGGSVETRRMAPSHAGAPADDALSVDESDGSTYRA